MGLRSNDLGRSQTKLRSALTKLRRRSLTQLQFDQSDVEAVAAGAVPPALLLLHFALLDFSPHVARVVVACPSSTYLLSSTDDHFTTLAFRALVDVFQYRPVLTPAMFLSPGRFKDRRCDLLCDVIDKVIAKDHELSNSHPRARSTSVSRTSALRMGDASHSSTRGPHQEGEDSGGSACHAGAYDSEVGIVSTGAVPESATKMWPRGAAPTWQRRVHVQRHGRVEERGPTSGGGKGGYSDTSPTEMEELVRRLVMQVTELQGRVLLLENSVRMAEAHAHGPRMDKLSRDVSRCAD